MQVINSREINDGKKRRRRYRCQKCKMTYVTLEEFTMVVVVKAVVRTSTKDATEATTLPLS
jgi:transcriptional regulator NrdR family protein